MGYSALLSTSCNCNIWSIIMKVANLQARMEIWAELQRIGTFGNIKFHFCALDFLVMGSVFFVCLFLQLCGDEKGTLHNSFIGFCKSVHFMPRFRLSHTLGIFTLVRAM